MKQIIFLFRKYGVRRFVVFALSELYARLWRYRVIGSFSQSAEDLTLDRLLKYKKKGIYVDIGAYDPYRFSNTMRFYMRGWRGINIEPDSERFKQFKSIRPRDINLNIGIANKRGSLTYFFMEPPTLSTFVKTQSQQYVKEGFLLKGQTKIPVLPLKTVLARHMGRKQIDFLSIDVEGFEIEVLKSNDWTRFRPTLLCIETAVEDDAGKKTLLIKRAIGQFLDKKGYTIVFDNGLNSFYSDIYHE